MTISLQCHVPRHTYNDNTSEQARRRLAPMVAKLLGSDEEVGSQVEALFTRFWQLARKADDMVDYSDSSDLKWLQILQQVFSSCTATQSLPSSILAHAWLKTVGHFFYLMSNTCTGEVEDLLFCRNPSDSEYNRMVLLKTGPWFSGRIVCTALAASRNTNNDLLEYGNLVSLTYQIRNDIVDTETEGKDIKIGKMNYPSLLMLQNAEECKQKDDAISLAKKIANRYEEKAQKIACRYSRDLELLTTELCSSS